MGEYVAKLEGLELKKGEMFYVKRNPDDGCFYVCRSQLNRNGRAGKKKQMQEKKEDVIVDNRSI